MNGDTEFSGCPYCSNTDGFVNVGRKHYFLCRAHGFAWNVGSNLLSGWREETEADWQKSRETLRDFTIVGERSGPVRAAPSIAEVNRELRRIAAGGADA